MKLVTHAQEALKLNVIIPYIHLVYNCIQQSAVYIFLGLSYVLYHINLVSVSLFQLGTALHRFSLWRNTHPLQKIPAVLDQALLSAGEVPSWRSRERGQDHCNEPTWQGNLTKLYGLDLDRRQNGNKQIISPCKVALVQGWIYSISCHCFIITECSRCNATKKKGQRHQTSFTSLTTVDQISPWHPSITNFQSLLTGRNEVDPKDACEGFNCDNNQNFINSHVFTCSFCTVEKKHHNPSTHHGNSWHASVLQFQARPWLPTVNTKAPRRMSYGGWTREAGCRIARIATWKICEVHEDMPIQRSCQSIPL